MALAASRIDDTAILDDGVGELIAVLNERPGLTSAIAARLPGETHAVVARYREGGGSP